MDYLIKPIGHVQGGRADPIDDDWGASRSVIALDPEQFGPEALAGLDAISGTPVVDIKPVMREFLPRRELHQPARVAELMARYW